MMEHIFNKHGLIAVIMAASVLGTLVLVSLTHQDSQVPRVTKAPICVHIISSIKEKPLGLNKIVENAEEVKKVVASLPNVEKIYNSNKKQSCTEITIKHSDTRIFPQDHEKFETNVISRPYFSGDFRQSQDGAVPEGNSKGELQWLAFDPYNKYSKYIKRKCINILVHPA